MQNSSPVHCANAGNAQSCWIRMAVDLLGVMQSILTYVNTHQVMSNAAKHVEVQRLMLLGLDNRDTQHAEI